MTRSILPRATLLILVAVAACGGDDARPRTRNDAGALDPHDASTDAGSHARHDADTPSDASNHDDASTGRDAAAMHDAGPSGDDEDAGGSGDGGPDGGSSDCVGGSPSIENVGSSGLLLLKGMVVTPDQAFRGEVFITGDTITCVAASCAGAADVGNATVVDTQGIIFPGLIDVFNHTQFDIFDADDWQPAMPYTNDDAWPNEARYQALVDAKQYLNAEAGSVVNLSCELDKYGELKGLIAGTTSIVGTPITANRSCYGSLARTIDQTPNGLGSDKIQTSTLSPSTLSADSVCSSFVAGDTDAYVINVARGSDMTARNQFASLRTVTTTDDCLLATQTTIAGGGSLGDTELGLMGQHAMSLAWMPRSEATLFGAAHSADVPLALTKGVNVTLATDWSITGSPNLLDELRFANALDDSLWGNQLTSQVLVKMVTSNAARALGLGSVLGSLAAGKKADIVVMAGDACAPYDALLSATPLSTRLVLVGGQVLYGDAALKSLGPSTPGCEDFMPCGAQKFVCFAAPSGSAADKLDQTFVQVQSALSSALQGYDDMNLSAYSFAPLAPLLHCPP